ncbi:unnamed protein product [Auanema sp. JU1783]|nr:unnamed protein product [Auanema sp. JU1783]
MAGEDCVGADYFQQCKYIHEVELVNMKLQMKILETHLETKDRLLRNLEDIIDEQETRIHNMEEFIQVLSLDFGALSEENFRLKTALAAHQKKERLEQLVETDEDYESDITTDDKKLSPTPPSELEESIQKKPYNEMVQSMMTEVQTKKLQRLAEELKQEKNELKQVALDTKDAFSVCMKELTLLLESKTTDFFRVLIERYRAEMEKRKQLHNQLVEINGNIRVFYRIRPVSECIKKAIEIDDLDNGIVYFTQTNGKQLKKSADRVIPMTYTQEQIFSEVSPIITSCIDGYNVCIFAYGHTGSGKTYTMEGPSGNPGINQRAIMQLFSTAHNSQGDIEYTISVSLLEIYNDKIRDLLNTNNTNLQLRLSEDGKLSIPGLTSVVVESFEHVGQVLNDGKKNKAVSATGANEESSRSHVIVRVVVQGRNRITNLTTIGRLNLVDLAGSERVSQTNATGQLLKEAMAINKSLSELGNCVLALRQNLKHIPFRNCQLTRLLEDSLTGDSKTLVLIHLSPDSVNEAETISSMNFAEKIGNIQTKYGSLKRDSIIRRSATQRKTISSDTFTPPSKKP